MKEFLDAILTELNTLGAGLVSAGTTSAAGTKLATGIGILKTKLATSPMYSKKVKTV